MRRRLQSSTPQAARIRPRVARPAPGAGAAAL